VLKVIVFSSLLVNIAPAAASSEPSAEFSACMDGSGGVTASMLDCLGAENKRLDDALNALWQSKFPNRSDILRDKLRTSQRAWITYRDATCDFHAAQHQGGSFASVAYADCYREATTDRFDWLSRALAGR
jgi:uncharacterized protein YecT (DUF1311 family)